MINSMYAYSTKMRRFILLIVCSYFSLCYSFADNAEEPLYFISAKQFYDPYVYYDDDEYENAYLFSLQNGNLDTIRTLSSYDVRTKQVDYYIDLYTIVITTEQKYGKYGLILLNTKNLDMKIIGYPILNEYPDEFSKYRIIVENDTNYLSINCYGSNHWKLNEKDEPTKMQPSQLLNFHCSVTNTERITYDSIRNCFTLPVIQLRQNEDKLLRPVLSYKISKSDYPQERWLSGLWIKNKLYSVIDQKYTENTRNYIIYQHQNDIYNILTLKGNVLNSNIWGEWLGGAETYDGNDVYNYIQKNNATLYLYNIPQNKLIQWNSHSNNAAILHIENNEVYYRINDTLYKAPILEDSIGEPEIIWQSDILKNVHWLWR